MILNIGIVGLPNVGKSTLFNALTRTKSAPAENYPFCTINPNVGVVEVPDKRLDKLSEVSNSAKKINAIIEFVDIAGLVKGASQGEGLGNKFLSHIRECDAIGHVIRMFDDPNVTHVHGRLDPKYDREVIESELLLADVQTLENRLIKANSDAKSGETEKKVYAELLNRILKKINEGILTSNMDLSDEEKEKITDLHLITSKPYLYFINIPESEIGKSNQEKYASMLGVDDPNKIIPICAQLEQELGDLSPEEADEYLRNFGIEKTGLNHLIRAVYETLGLITYFTSGPKESRAWTIKKGTLAPQAAGVIHTDFEKGFIKADIIFWEDFVKLGGEIKAREKGLIRSEGKDYVMQDGDTAHFKFSS